MMFTRGCYIKLQTTNIKHLAHLVREERIVPLLLPNCRHRPVARTNNRFVGEHQNFLEIICNRVLIRNAAATHRTGEKRIANHGNLPCETGADEGHSTWGMSPGQAR